MSNFNILGGAKVPLTPMPNLNRDCCAIILVKCSNVTFTCRFWHGKRIACEQTRLRAVVLVAVLAKPVCIKKVPTSQQAVNQVCTEFDAVQFFIAVK